MTHFSAAKALVLWFASITFLVYSEWLFQITKPSFLSRSTLVHNFELALLVTLAVSIIVMPLFGLSLGIAFKCRNKTVTRILFFGFPASLFAIATLLMLDNFTHTLLAVNIGSVTGWWRIAYLILLLAVAADILKKLERITHTPWPKSAVRSLQILAFFAILLVSFSLMKRANISVPKPGLPTSVQKGPRPNIIILSTDGLRAANMSAYGYSRETTPFIDSLKDETLKFKGHFVNASHTTGSLMALLSGRLPTCSKVIYRPDIFRGIESFQHLPGILRSLGYYTMDVSLEYYADPFDLNMRGAFDLANFRRESDIQFASRLPRTWQVRFDGEIYFLEQFAKRLMDRLAHMTYIRDLGNPYFIVTHTGSENRLDEQTLDRTISTIETASQPFFLHVHLLGTHGPKFGPSIQQFSKDKIQDQEWMLDFYDDAILNFDGYAAKLFANMKEKDLLDNTMIILTSDHGHQFTPWQAVPMIVRFPQGSRSGVVDIPSQQIDVAPTILEYLKVPIPSWMNGHSLLDLETRQPDPIVSVIPGKLSQATNGWRVAEHYRPPFYSMGTFSVIVDGTWYGLNLKKNVLYRHHTDSKKESSTDVTMLSEADARQIIENKLKDSGYDLE